MNLIRQAQNISIALRQAYFPKYRVETYVSIGDFQLLDAPSEELDIFISMVFDHNDNRVAHVEYPVEYASNLGFIAQVLQDMIDKDNQAIEDNYAEIQDCIDYIIENR